MAARTTYRGLRAAAVVASLGCASLGGAVAAQGPPLSADGSGAAAASTGAAAASTGAAAPAAPAPPAAPAAGADGSGEAPPADVAGVAVTATVESEAAVRIGESVRVAVDVTFPPTTQLVSLEVVGTRYVELRRLDDVAAGPAGAAWPVALTAYRPGRFEGLRVAAVIIDAAGRQGRVESAPFDLRFVSTIVNESAPEPAPSSRPVPVMTRDPRPVYAAAALLVFALGGLAAAAVRRRPGAEEAAPAPPARPAWEVALELLHALEAEDLLSAGEHFAYTTRLSEILRGYLGARFGLPGLEMTTRELRDALGARPEAAGPWAADVAAALADMDLVKFAKFTPPRDLCDELLASARRLVQEMTVRDEARDAAAAEPTVGAAAAAEPTVGAAAPRPGGGDSGAAADVEDGGARGRAEDDDPRGAQ